MNITKQQWTIIGVIVAVIAVWYFFLRKKKAESSFGRRGTIGGSLKEVKCPDTCQTVSITTPSGVQTGCKCPTTNTGSIGWGKPSA